MNPKTDADLIREIKNGDIMAFEILVKRYQQPLFRYAFRLTGNVADSEDIVQNTLFNIYTAIDRIDVSRKISSYIFTVTKNSAVSLLRQKKITLPLEESLEAGNDMNIFERLIRKDDADNVRQAILSLDPKYRQVIRLYYFDDLAYEEIGHKLKIPLNTVRTLLRRAKDKLKIILNYETN